MGSGGVPSGMLTCAALLVAFTRVSMHSVVFDLLVSRTFMNAGLMSPLVTVSLAMLNDWKLKGWTSTGATIIGVAFGYVAYVLGILIGLGSV